MTNNGWWREIEAVIERRSLLKHPFYRAWVAGALSLDDLRHYARQYYPHVARFPRYVSAVHSGIEDLKLRQGLLENLIEEERGPENHPELWLRFAEGLGLKREEVLEAGASPETRACVDRFQELARDEDPVVGLSALYAYESQLPAVSATKLDGLSRFYGITGEGPRAFFKVHQEADVWHSRQEREWILALARTPEARESAKRSAAAAADAVWGLLDGVASARGICAAC